MPNPCKFNQEAVNAVANALLAQGEKVSIDKIIVQLGSGSKGTVGPMLKVWREALPSGKPPTIVLPDELQRLLHAYLINVATEARTGPEALLAEARAVEEELLAECKARETEVDALSVELETARKALAIAEGRSNQLAADAEQLKNELNRERQATASAQVELAKAALRLESLPRLEAELTECRALLTNERDARSIAERNAAVAIEKAIGLESRLADFRARFNAHST